MVDRVGNNPVYGYTSVNDKKVNTNTAGAEEKFRLNYGKEGAIYEPSSEALKRQQAEKGTTARTQETAKVEEDGVRLTLSSATTENTKISGNENVASSGSILDVLTNAVTKVVDAIKSFVSSIWNDEPKAIETEVTEKPKTQFEKAKAEAEAFLASSEGKKVARNSDLLTYYDKRGVVINVSPSDRQRILYGDKNQIEV